MQVAIADSLICASWTHDPMADHLDWTAAESDLLIESHISIVTVAILVAHVMDNVCLACYYSVRQCGIVISL